MLFLGSCAVWLAMYFYPTVHGVDHSVGVVIAKPCDCGFSSALVRSKCEYIHNALRSFPELTSKISRLQCLISRSYVMTWSPSQTSFVAVFPRISQVWSTRLPEGRLVLCVVTIADGDCAIVKALVDSAIGSSGVLRVSVKGVPRCSSAMSTIIKSLCCMHTRAVWPRHTPGPPTNLPISTASLMCHSV